MKQRNFKEVLTEITIMPQNFKHLRRVYVFENQNKQKEGKILLNNQIYKFSCIWNWKNLEQLEHGLIVKLFWALS